MVPRPSEVTWAIPYLQLPWAHSDLAPGYTLGAGAEESQVLVHHSRGAIATAPDPAFALLTLVPLSHLLGFSAADLRRAFMAEDGAPLLSNGYYAPR
ncbi:Imm61 family immunity protein (plasmid) [Mycobacterium sp. TJFP1]